MTLRAFFLTTDTRAALADLAAFAGRPENFYRVGQVDWIPGDRPEFVRVVDTFRVVYSISVLPDGLRFRHLSVSLTTFESGHYPNQFVVFTIATLLGFTGGTARNDVTLAPGPDWEMQAIAHYVGLSQPLDPS